MSSTFVLPVTSMASGRISQHLSALANSMHSVMVDVAAASAQPSITVTERDLGDEFGFWADESLEWSHATFDTQAETWPSG